MRNQSPLQQQVKDLIRQGDTPGVFKLLASSNLSSAQVKTLTLIEAAYFEIKQAELKGVATTDELQIRKNKINNQLLELLDLDGGPTPKSSSKKIPIAALVSALLLISLLWWYFKDAGIQCPSYPAEVNNKILVLPFENVGDAPAKPQVNIYKRINELTTKNNLSALAQLAEINNDKLSEQKVRDLGSDCDLDLLVWGTFSSRADSIRLVMEYYFTKAPETNVLSELVTLKDVTSLQKGTMLKNLDDAIFSLCGVIALREGNNALAKKWFEKVGGKEQMDMEVLKALN
jgi:Effector-associated domain 11